MLLNYRGFVRRYEFVELLQNIVSTKYLGELKKVSLSDEKEAFELLEDSVDTFQSRYLVYRNSSSVMYTRRKDNSGTNMVLPDVLILNSAAYVLRVLSTPINGLPLSELLIRPRVVVTGRTPTTYYSLNKGNKGSAPTLDGSLTSRELNDIAARLQLNAAPITANEIGRFEKLVDAFVNLPLKLNEKAKTNPPLEVVYLCAAVDYLESIRSIFNVVKGPVKTFKIEATKQVALPLLLDNACEDILKDLYLDKFDRALVEGDQQIADILIRDIFELTPHGVQIKSGFFKTFLSDLFRYYSRAYTPKQRAESSFDAKYDATIHWVRSEIVCAEIMHRDPDKLASLLLPLVNVSDFNKKEMVAKPEELMAAVKEERSRLGDFPTQLIDVISQYFIEVTNPFDLIGDASYYKSYAAGNCEVIYRLHIPRIVHDDLTLLSYRVAGNGEKLVRAVSQQISTRVVDQNAVEKTYTVSALRSAGAKCHSTQEGCVVMFDDVAQLRQLVAGCSRFLELTIDRLAGLVSANLRVGVATIYPPQLGDNTISFGTTRREVHGKDFRAVVVDPASCDLISLLMSWRSNELLDSSSAELERRYLSRVEALVKPPRIVIKRRNSAFIVGSVAISPTVSYLLGGVNDYVDALVHSIRTLYVPSTIYQEISGDPSGKLLPTQVEVERYKTFSFTLPQRLVDPDLIMRITSDIEVVVGFRRDGAPSVALRMDSNNDIVVTVNVDLKREGSFSKPDVSVKGDNLLVNIDWRNLAIESVVRNGALIMNSDGIMGLEEVLRPYQYINGDTPVAGALSYICTLLQSYVALGCDRIPMSFGQTETLVVKSYRIILNELIGVFRYLNDTFALKATDLSQIGGSTTVRLSTVAGVIQKVVLLTQKAVHKTEFSTDQILELIDKAHWAIQGVTVRQTFNNSFVIPPLVDGKFAGLAACIGKPRNVCECPGVLSNVNIPALGVLPGLLGKLIGSFIVASVNNEALSLFVGDVGEPTFPGDIITSDEDIDVDVVEPSISGINLVDGKQLYRFGQYSYSVDGRGLCINMPIDDVKTAIALKNALIEDGRVTIPFESLQENLTLMAATGGAAWAIGPIQLRAISQAIQCRKGVGESDDYLLKLFEQLNSWAVSTAKKELNQEDESTVVWLPLKRAFF